MAKEPIDPLYDVDESEADEDAAWRELTIQQFLRDDAPEDAIYDDLR